MGLLWPVVDAEIIRLFSCIYLCTISTHCIITQLFIVLI
jgi:hypothetical protein